MPDEVARAEVVLTHGLGEHSGRYEHVAGRFAEAGIRLIAYDLRGHGRSGGTRGDAPAYRSLLADLGRVLAEGPRGDGPLFLMGHSLGGQITLRYLLEHPQACRGAIVASPWLRLAFAPSRWRVALARLASRWWPTLIQRTPGEAFRLSRDAPHLASLPEPELVHHVISARLYLAIQESGEMLLAEAPALRTPVLLLHGSADEVTSATATRDFYERAGSKDKRLLLLPDALHETHNDLGREQVLAEILAWVQARL